MSLPPRFTLREYCDTYGGNINTIRAQCKAGAIPGSYKAGHQWFIPAKFILDQLGVNSVDRVTVSTQSEVVAAGS